MNNRLFYEQMFNELKDKALISKIRCDLGGKRFYIPQNIDKGHLLYRYGEIFFKYMIKIEGGNTIVFPR